MKFLLDQGLPRSAADLMRQAGFDVVHTAEIGMTESLDEEILKRALAEERIVVTLDADFHTLLVLSKLSKPSIIRFRIEGLRAEKLTELLLEVTRQCEEDLAAGALISVQEHQIRIRRLPVF
jgi:predicted nuclease of predicted toxin-antitoxin system